MSRDSSSIRERIYATFADESLDFEASVQTALEFTADYLGVEYGFLTRIEDGQQRILQAVGSHELLQPGESCPLEQAYCRRTIQISGTLSVQDAAVSPEVSTTAFETFELGCYIGTKVVVDGEVYGTVCFGDSNSRGESFSESEGMLVELVGQLVSQVLERRAYQQTLADQNRQLETERQTFEEIAETTFDVIYRIDRGGVFTYASSSVERIIGYSPEELVGTPFAEHICESSLPRTVDAFDQLLDGESVEHLEIEFERKGGETVILEVNARPIYNGGDVELIQGVARDITNRVERERELRLQHRALEDTNVGITIAEAAEPEFVITYANEAFEALSGYSRDEIMGRPYRDFFVEDAGPEEAADIREALVSGDSSVFDLLVTRQDDTPLWCRTSISPVTGDFDEVTHYVGFHENVTEEKRTVRLVELLNRVLRHNLRNSMNVILGNIELLNDPEMSSIAVGRIRERGQDLVRLSERAQELKRYAHRERDPQRLDPKELVARIVEQHEESNPQATITVDVQSDRGICAGSELSRALSELVANAISHHPTESAHVSISVADAGDQIRIEVVDDGEGVSPSETSFVQMGRETDLEHGSSMGLWLVNWIVTRYGGSFQIGPADEDNRGTRATILVPSIDPETSVEAAAKPSTALFW
ncbi:light and oxygen sensing histidine kinase [Haloferax elongans ATCC BAA-1513]|uniref:Light and oxygen sensing histidine kinase n=1 Tax=Haloferax elongans ATCC BAA-1513 TaxID=1230453 RepID=M0HUV4_HALEO|nr:PAS domain S-box protein [Haloferax elongans]ELZ87462.1 light and oxygen sensing histidine kinase [Haloferax elongans ATCC BAA-1513]